MRRRQEETGDLVIFNASPRLSPAARFLDCTPVLDRSQLVLQAVDRLRRDKAAFGERQVAIEVAMDPRTVVAGERKRLRIT